MEPAEGRTVIDLTKPADHYSALHGPFRLHVMHAPEQLTADAAVCEVGDVFTEAWEQRVVFHADTLDLGDGVCACIACGLVFYSQRSIN